MPANWTDVTSADGGVFKAYEAHPSDGPRPGIVMVQEIFGVNAAMRKVADRFAASGFAVMVPDLFWRLEPGVDLSYGEDERKQAFGLMGRFDVDQGVKDIGDTVEALRRSPACNGKVAVLGFCLGGTLAFLSAARLKVDAAVAYYGTAIHKHLDEAKSIASPTLYHFAENDQFVPAEEVQRIRAALSGRSDAEIHTYPGVGHAFSNVDRTGVYDEEAAKVAHRRTEAFLGRLA